MYPNNNGDSKTGGQWTTGLFGCFEDCSSCVTTCCCPAMTFGRNAEIIDKGDTSCGSACAKYFLLSCCAFIYSHSFRTKLRGLYSLPEEPCNDCCVHYCFMCCAVCQEHRELKNRGFDPLIGWAANAERMNGKSTTAPYIASGMNR